MLSSEATVAPVANGRNRSPAFSANSRTVVGEPLIEADRPTVASFLKHLSEQDNVIGQHPEIASRLEKAVAKVRNQ